MILKCRDEGTGPALVLIHAFPLNHTMWEPQVAVFRSRYRIVCPDLRGFGGTSNTVAWTIDQAADDVAETLDAHGITECYVGGLSMGGYIALPFYSKYSDRVRKLILANTRARADNEAERNGRDDLIAALQQSGPDVLPDRMLPRLVGPDARPDVVRNVRNLIERAPVESVIFALQAIRDRKDSSAVLAQIHCPTLVIGGDSDVITRIEECRSMAEAISGSTFEMISHSGHLSNLENAAAFNQALNSFLK